MKTFKQSMNDSFFPVLGIWVTLVIFLITVFYAINEGFMISGEMNSHKIFWILLPFPIIVGFTLARKHIRGNFFPILGALVILGALFRVSFIVIDGSFSQGNVDIHMIFFSIIFFNIIFFYNHSCNHF